MNRDEALSRLREWYPRGSVVYTVTRSRSRSGESIVVSPIAFCPDTSREAGGAGRENMRPLWPVYAAACALGGTVITDDTGAEGIRVSRRTYNHQYNTLAESWARELIGVIWNDPNACHHWGI